MPPARDRCSRETMTGARMGCPLVVGLGDGENFLASDVSALISETRRVIYLDDGDVVGGHVDATVAAVQTAHPELTVEEFYRETTVDETSTNSDVSVSMGLIAMGISAGLQALSKGPIGSGYLANLPETGTVFTGRIGPRAEGHFRVLARQLTPSA